MKDGKLSEEDMQKVKEKLERQWKAAAELAKKHKNLSGLTAYIMAGDMQGAELAEQQMAEKNLTVEQASIYVGSYYRLNWLAEQYWKGKLSEDWLVKGFPSEWAYTDHFGADIQFLRLWILAYEKNSKRTIIVGDKKLPNEDVLTIYRGQDINVPLGYSWTLDKEIGAAFASGRGSRTDNRELGVLYVGQVARRKVLGYITTRKEEEIVVDPRYVKVVDRL